MDPIFLPIKPTFQSISVCFDLRFVKYDEVKDLQSICKFGKLGTSG
ncbi:MAG: hypothetical protein V2G51_02670 [bacterium JZ-2024 1]